MTVYLTKNTRNLLILGILFISLFFSFKKSKIIDTFLNPAKIEIGSSPAKVIELFDSYVYSSKFDIRFVSMNIDEIKIKAENIIKDNNINSVYTTENNTNISKLIEIPIDKSQEILSSFRSLPNLVSDELIKSKESISVEYLKRRIIDEEAVKNNILHKLKNARTYTDIDEYRLDLREQEEAIKELESELKAKEQRSSFILAKIDISKKVIAKKLILTSLKTFGLTMVLSMAFIIIALFFCYFVIVTLFMLFNIFGIRTGSQSRYGGRYSSRSKRSQLSFKDYFFGHRGHDSSSSYRSKYKDKEKIPKQKVENSEIEEDTKK